MFSTAVRATPSPELALVKLRIALHAGQAIRKISRFAVNLAYDAYCSKCLARLGADRRRHGQGTLRGPCAVGTFLGEGRSVDNNRDVASRYGTRSTRPQNPISGQMLSAHDTSRRLRPSKPSALENAVAAQRIIRVSDCRQLPRLFRDPDPQELQVPAALCSRTPAPLGARGSPRLTLLPAVLRGEGSVVRCLQVIENSLLY
jgi:hypothetical protein